MLPYMVPDFEPLCDVRLDFEDQESAEHSYRAGEEHCPYAAGAHKCDYDECHEEDACGAEVLH